jgi:hypothetical protein
MKHTSYWLGALLALGLLVEPASAQPGRGFARVGGLAQALDTDGDRVISQKEMEDAPRVLLALDRNKDDILTPDEGTTGRPIFRQSELDPLGRVLDTDRNSELSKKEINDAGKRLAVLDTNEDGKLTRDEYAGLPPGRARRGGGVAGASRWFFDYRTARAEAARMGKPMMLVFRCVP